MSATILVIDDVVTAREAIADLIGKGGFPPLLLSPVNFDALYSQKQAKLKDQATSEETKH